MNKLMFVAVAALTLCGMTGCQTQTREFVKGETRQTVAGFSQKDIEKAVSEALEEIFADDRIPVPQGANRVLMIVDDIVNDTNMRGSDASALSGALSQQIRRGLMRGKKIAIYNPQAGQYAKVQVEPEYHLSGRLTQRNVRQDNGDFQREYNLEITILHLATGVEVEPIIVHIGKLIDESRGNW